ncbi:MAG: PKD-like family lipoprotein [Ginsengibacter sp.]
MIACLALFQISCYKDKTTEDTYSVTDIKIELANIEKTVNIDKNEKISLSPIVTQSKGNLDLTYEWQVDYKVVSTEKDFTYSGTDLGSYVVRLKVSNADGSAFKSFVLNVNSPYEEGLMVLGENQQGLGTLSFLRKLTPAEKEAGKVEGFATNLFELNNPGKSIGKGPSDLVKRGRQLYISSADDGKISVVNGKTLELEAVVTAPEFPNFKPFKLNVPDNTSTSSIILNKDGKLFTLASQDLLILKNTNLTDNVPNADLAMKTAVVGTMNFTHNYFWDKDGSKLWNFWYIGSNSLDVLANQELISFFPTTGAVYTLTRDKTDPSKLTKTVFGEFIQVYFQKPIDLKEKREFTNPAPTLTENSITLVNQKFVKLVYANGGSIYNWFYTGIDIPSTPFISIPIPGVVTSLASNPAGTELYVGVYNSAASGLKGSVLVYNIDNGALINKYEGVSDKPVKLFYKTKI